MTIVSEGPLCLKIHLSKYELKKYFNKYSEINIGNSNIRKTINSLFSIAANYSNFELTGKKMIEIFPTASGGCILKFTSEPLPFQLKAPAETRNLKLKSNANKNNPYIFCFKDFESLLRVIAELNNNKITKKYTSNLYYLNNKYFLKILIPVFDIKTGIFINEFSEYSTKGIFAESKLNEYSVLLIENSTIEILSKYFLKV